MSDLISRADAIEAMCSKCLDRETCTRIVGTCESAIAVAELPSADAVDVAHDIPEYCRWSQTYTNMVQSAVADTKSAEAVQLKQTDTLIIADALRYLAQDTERHLSDRTRADALREQILKYGASMCHSADAEPQESEVEE